MCVCVSMCVCACVSVCTRGSLCVCVCVCECVCERERESEREREVGSETELCRNLRLITPVLPSVYPCHKSTSELLSVYLVTLV